MIVCWLKVLTSHFLSAKEVRVTLGRRGRTDEWRDQEISEKLWWLLKQGEKRLILGPLLKETILEGSHYESHHHRRDGARDMRVVEVLRVRRESLVLPPSLALSAYSGGRLDLGGYGSSLYRPAPTDAERTVCVSCTTDSVRGPRWC